MIILVFRVNQRMFRLRFENLNNTLNLHNYVMCNISSLFTITSSLTPVVKEKP